MKLAASRHATFSCCFQGAEMKIVLASESPFPRRALDMLGIAYEVCPSKVDEKAIRNHSPVVSQFN